MLGSAAASEAIAAALAILQTSEHFFGVNLGELDSAWPEFSDVQSVRLPCVFLCWPTCFTLRPC
jgi:hypothetical protein